jgi:Tfp pilus assembly protein PilF
MERAVALDPGRVYHRLELARIYADRKRYADARAELDRLAALPDREIMDSVYRREGMALARKLAGRT